MIQQRQWYRRWSSGNDGFFIWFSSGSSIRIVVEVMWYHYGNGSGCNNVSNRDTDIAMVVIEA